MGNTGKKNLSKDQWLAKALTQLTSKGNLGLSIEELAKAVGVTKGSYYWHFRSREGFVHDLFDYWADISTTKVIEYVEQVEGTPSERLLALSKFLIEEDICRHELAIRGWVQIHPVLTPLLEEIDLRRYEYVAGIFKEIGFTGDDLKMRVRTFLVFYALETSLYPTQSLKDRIACLTLRHQCLTEVNKGNEPV